MSDYIWEKVQEEKIKDELPTKISQLENDVGYITNDELPTKMSQLENDIGYITNDELDAHKAESASKHIKESGSNANGSYIKFDDGTMICYIRGIRVTGNGSTYVNLSVPLPANFVNSNYTVIVTPTTRYRVSDGVRQTTKYFNAMPVTLSPNAIATLRFVYGDGSILEPTYEFEVNLVAIGRWK